MQCTNPDSEDRDADTFFKVDVDQVRLTGSKWSEPHVSIVLGTIDAVDEVRHDAWVSAVVVQDVDVTGVGPDLTACDKHKNTRMQCLKWKIWGK